MKLAVVGVGNVGGNLAEAAVAAANEVTLASPNREDAHEKADALGAKPADSVAEAAAGADAILLAVPYQAAADVVLGLGPSADGATIIDVTNPLIEAYDDLVAEPPAAEELQALAPGAKIVKAFNTIFASRHTDPTEGGTPLDAFYAGDDDAAKATAADLAESLGYRPIDAGPLRMARSLEAMAFLNISLNVRNGWAWRSGWKLVGPTG